MQSRETRVCEYTSHDHDHTYENSRFILLTFWDDGKPSYHAKVERLVHGATSIGGFDDAIIYHLSQLPAHFIARNGARLKDRHSHGMGAWMWKPMAIFDTLARDPRVATGDVLCYLDSEYEFRGSMRPFYSAIHTLEPPILMFRNKPNDPMWLWEAYESAPLGTHYQRFDAMGFEHGHYQQVLDAWAGMMCVRKSSATLQFVSEWLADCQRWELVALHTNDQWLLTATAVRWNIHETHMFPFPPARIGPLINLRDHEYRLESDPQFKWLGHRFRYRCVDWFNEEPENYFMFKGENEWWWLPFGKFGNESLESVQK